MKVEFDALFAEVDCIKLGRPATQLLLMLSGERVSPAFAPESGNGIVSTGGFAIPFPYVPRCIASDLVSLGLIRASVDRIGETRVYAITRRGLAWLVNNDLIGMEVFDGIKG